MAVKAHRPADPAVRLWLLSDRLKGQRRMIAAALLVAVIVASAWVRASAPPTEVWSQSELNNMSGLPLSPSGVEVDPDGITPEDREAMIKLQKDMKQQSGTDLLDPASNPGEGT